MIYIAGHNGMVGSSLLRNLKKLGHKKFLLKSRNDLDLTNQYDVNSFFKKYKPTQIYIAAAKVGGIFANNTYPADFIYTNIMIATNIINAAFKNGIKKLLFIGSSCIYPKFSQQPIKEEYLLTGQLEKTNEPYAISKIAGIKLCESFNRQYSASHKLDYRCVMPTNLYGFGDNYSDNLSHVIPSLIKRFHEAKKNKISEVKVWGSGKAKREFLFVDDFAHACIKIMNLEKNIYEKYTSPMSSHINIGYGHDVSIKDLAKLISKEVGYNGNVIFDESMPDGTPRKLLDISIIKFLNWEPKVSLKDGIRITYEDYLNSLN